MDQQNTPQVGMAKSGSMNFAIGAVAIVAVLLLVGYIMSMKHAAPDVAQTSGTGAPGEDAATVALSSQGSSDDISAISADLEATDLNSLNDTDKI